MKVAAVEPRRVEGRAFLLVERYDREIDADGRIRRLHQEDFCQASDSPWRHGQRASALAMPFGSGDNIDLIVPP